MYNDISWPWCWPGSLHPNSLTCLNFGIDVTGHDEETFLQTRLQLVGTRGVLWRPMEGTHATFAWSFCESIEVFNCKYRMYFPTHM